MSVTTFITMIMEVKESEEEDELELQEETENEQDNQQFVPLEEFVINQGILDPSEPASPLFSTNEHTSEDTTSIE
uniref:Candidate secreted effector n=1 Tax=Meloidogyne incognita TaxID=6306 RepID=A0A914MD56_MELIC